MDSHMLNTTNEVLRTYLYHEGEAWLDPKLLIGIVFAAIALVLLITSVRDANDSLCFYGDLCYRVAANLILLSAVDSFRNDRLLYIVMGLHFPKFLTKMLCMLKTATPYSFGSKCNASSIYLRFELAKLYKVVLVFILQCILMLFYWVSISGEPAGFKYVYWLCTLPAQEVAGLTYQFGEDMDISLWVFLWRNAGTVALVRDDKDEEVCRITVPETVIHGAMAVLMELFVRNLLILTLPLFLMQSETPLDFMMNCVASGFIVTISHATTAAYTIVTAAESDDEV